jgi:predicted amino acid dehydrogenase
MLLLARMVKDLMHPDRRRGCRRLVAQYCILLVRENGAKVVRLGGMTASLMKYDRLLAGVADDMLVTTGHTVTAISCVRTLLSAVDRFGLDPESEQLTILGMGSVGSAFLELVVTQPRCPRQIVLSDLPEKSKSVQALIDRLEPNLPAAFGPSLVPSRSDGLGADQLWSTTKPLSTRD